MLPRAKRYSSQMQWKLGCAYNTANVWLSNIMVAAQQKISPEQRTASPPLIWALLSQPAQL